MLENAVARRYAQAFFAIAQEKMSWTNLKKNFGLLLRPLTATRS